VTLTAGVCSVGDKEEQQQETTRWHFWKSIVWRRSVAFVAVFTLFLSTATWLWDEFVAPQVKPERRKVIEWINVIPWYDRLLIGMALLVVLIGEGAFRHIRKKDAWIASLNEQIKTKHTREEIQEWIGQRLQESKKLKELRSDSESEVRALRHELEAWRLHTIAGLEQLGLTAEMHLFETADSGATAEARNRIGNAIEIRDLCFTQLQKLEFALREILKAKSSSS